MRGLGHHDDNLGREKKDGRLEGKGGRRNSLQRKAKWERGKTVPGSRGKGEVQGISRAR